MEVGEEENRRKDSAQKRAMKSSFIRTVSSEYQCRYFTIPSGVSLSSKTIECIHNYSFCIHNKCIGLYGNLPIL